MKTEDIDEETNETDTDWKDKKGFDFHERLTLKINAREAERYNQNKKNQKHNKVRPEKLHAGLNKLRKKIRDAFDEDDEDEDDFIFIPKLQFEEEDNNQLVNGLNEAEKRMLKQKENIQIIQMQQTAGKMEALQTADNLAKDTINQGLDKKLLNAKLQDAVFNPQEVHNKIIKDNVGAKLGIRGKIEDGKVIQAARGIKKVQELGGEKSTKDLDMKDVVKAGEGKMSEKDLAKLILQKSGQDVTKYESSKKKNKEKTQLKHLEPKKLKMQKQRNQAQY